MAGDQTDHGTGQPQSGLLFQNIDDLWKYGKPTGWGSLWLDDAVSAGELSDPFLMTGFDKKTLHLRNSSDHAVTIQIQVDFLGNETWSEYKTVTVDAGKYEYHIFPDGYNAHWVRLKSSEEGTISATFFYQ